MTLAAEGDRPALTDAEKLRESFKRISGDGLAMAEALYKKLFETSPEIQALFDGVDLPNQRRMLIGSLHYIVMNYERHGVLNRTLRRLGERHVGYGAKEEHYPIFEDCLIRAMAQISGSDWNDDLEALWRKAYRDVTAIMTSEGEMPSSASLDS